MDPFASSRLPDLPNAGYASRKAKETSDAIMIFMRRVERERALLLMIVVDGIDKWLKTAGTVWKGLLIDKQILTDIYKYFVLQAGANPAEQLLILHGLQQQQKREVWDKRMSTRQAFQKQQRASLADLRRELKRKPH